MAEVYAGYSEYTGSQARQAHPERGAILHHAGYRGIWKDGWEAVAVHAPLTVTSNFDSNVWEPFHVDADRSEANKPVEQEPEKPKRADLDLV